MKGICRKKNLKVLLALVMTLSMLIGMFPMNALAEEPEAFDENVHVAVT